MTQAKLHIDLREGVLDVEGEADFVLKIYSDFRSALAEHSRGNADDGGRVAAGEVKTDDTTRTRKKGKRVSSVRKSSSLEGGETASVSSHKPSLDKQLDTAKLNEFMSAYEPKNTAERILLFTKFMDEELGISPCNVDQIYTCFIHTKTKIPTAFGQVFINTRGDDYGYINFTSPTDITISMRGINHLNHDIKKTA